MQKILSRIYKGEHFVFMGETLYRKLDDGEGFEAVDGEKDGALTLEFIKKEPYKSLYDGQERLFTIVDPVKWAMNHFYWREPREEIEDE